MHCEKRRVGEDFTTDFPAWPAAPGLPWRWNGGWRGICRARGRAAGAEDGDAIALAELDEDVGAAALKGMGVKEI